MSDHFPIVFALKTNETTPKPVLKSTYKRSYREKNIDKFKNTLHNRNWDGIKKIEDPNKAYKYFLNIFRDHTLSVLEEGPEGFCWGHEIFWAYIGGP